MGIFEKEKQQNGVKTVHGSSDGTLSCSEPSEDKVQEQELQVPPRPAQKVPQERHMASPELVHAGAASPSVNLGKLCLQRGLVHVLTGL